MILRYIELMRILLLFCLLFLIFQIMLCWYITKIAITMMLFHFFSLQRNRLLIIPWLINSLISLLFNGIGIVLTVVISMKSNAPDYSSIIPFTVAAVIVFGNYNFWFIFRFFFSWTKKTHLHTLNLMFF